jgi:hypothetical protein
LGEATAVGASAFDETARREFKPGDRLKVSADGDESKFQRK